MTRWIWPVLFVFLLAALPDLVVQAKTNPQIRWSGILAQNTLDVNTYLSFVEQIRRDGLLARNLYTPEPQPAFIIRPTYMVAGLAGKVVPPISSLWIMEGCRLLAAMCLLLFLRFLTKQLFADGKDNTIAFFVLALGAGLGWLAPAESPDVIAPEASPMIALLSPPHFAVSLALLLGILWLLQKQGKGDGIIILLSSLWLALDHPFDLLPLAVAIGGTLIASWYSEKQFPKSLFARSIYCGIGAAIGTGIQLILLQKVAVYAAWNRQNFVPSPSLPLFLLSLGLLLPLAVYGFLPARKVRPQLAWMLLFFAATSMICSRLPFRFQWRFVEGLPQTLGLLACYGLFALRSRLSVKLRFVGVGLLMALLMGSAAMALLQIFITLKAEQPPQFLPAKMFAALQEAGRISPETSVFLSTEFTGNFLPAYSARAVVLGHRVQTVNASQQRALVEQILRTDAADPRALSLFRKCGATWLFWGPAEKGVARGAFDPEKAAFLKNEFDNGVAALYSLR